VVKREKVKEDRRRRRRSF